MIRSCLIIGGDNRQRLLAERLLQQGIAVYCVGMENCVALPKGVVQARDWPAVDLTLFPLPVTRDGRTVYGQYADHPVSLRDAVEGLSPQTRVGGGLIPSAMLERLQARKIPTFDYGKDETFQQLNAIPSAEGAIEIAMQSTPFTLDGARVCVVGFGRIGKALVQKLLGLSCRVTATARKQQDLEAIRQAGAQAVATSQLAEQGGFDVIFNTVPALVVDEAVLRVQFPHTLVIDLASKPGGVDFEAARVLNLHCNHALSLPARCAPLTAAAAIQTVVLDYFTETD